MDVASLSLSNKSLPNLALDDRIHCVGFNSLTTVGYLLGVFFRLWIPLWVHVSTSAWSQHWKLELKSFFDTISLGLWPQPHPLISKLSMVRAVRPAHAHWMLPTSPEMMPLQGEGNGSWAFCANKVGNSPASADQGFSKARQGSCHVHGTPCWNPPTSSYPRLSPNTKPTSKTGCTNW